MSTSSRSKKGRVDFLITGAAGFIGERLVKRLLSDGHTVQGVDLQAGSEPTLRMDITSEEQVLATFRRLRPRAVIHLAAVVDDRGAPELFERVNVDGTQHVVSAAIEAEVERFVHVSSIVALGFDPGHDAGEASPLVFDTGVPYFDTKARSEALVREAMKHGSLRGCVLRPGDVYGERSVPWVVRPIDMMRKRLPVLVAGGRGLMAHCHVDNLVQGLSLAATHPDALGHIFQIHEATERTTYRRYFTLLAEQAGVPKPTFSLPFSFGVGVGRVFDQMHRRFGIHPPFGEGAVRYVARQSTYSLSTARGVLGYTPTITLEEGIANLNLSR